MLLSGHFDVTAKDSYYLLPPPCKKPHNKMYIFCDLLFFFSSFSFLFFVIALPLPLSLVWNSHAYTMGSSIPGLHFFVGVAMD